MSDILVFVAVGLVLSVWIIRRLSPWIESHYQSPPRAHVRRLAVTFRIDTRALDESLERFRQALVDVARTLAGDDATRRCMTDRIARRRPPVDTGTMRRSWRARD